MALVFFLCNIGSPFGLSVGSVLAVTPPVSAGTSPEQLTAQGLQAFQHGAFVDAVSSWREGARLYEKEGKAHGQSTALIQLAHAYQAIGQYQEAVASLHTALALVEKTGDRAQRALILWSLGGAHLALGAIESAERYLQDSFSVARELRNDDLAAVILNDHGTLFASQQKYAEALSAYQESATLAQRTGNRTLAARALTNTALAFLHNGQPQEAKVRLDVAVNQMSRLDPSHNQAYGLISVGLAYSDLRPHLPDSAAVLVGHAARALTQAAGVAESLGDLRTASYAWGHLGKLYEDAQRYDQALQLTRQATFAAQQVNAPEALYRWQWQTGRLLKTQHELDGAIAAYHHAVETLQSIRQEITLHPSGPQSSFRESVGPVYFGLVDLLLQRAAQARAAERQQQDLKDARDTVELLKVAELRDYFRDDCVDAVRARTRKLEEVIPKTTAVIYPILLPDRMELLVSLPNGLKSVAVPVGAETVQQQVRTLRSTVVKRTTLEFFPHAQQLYNWLIRPLESDLSSFSIDTLVFVPDGPLRTVPMAVLHDGKHFLISKYAVATTPGLELTDPRPIQRDHTTVLAAGLTEGVQGFSPLPNVATELQAVQRLYGGEVLLNQEFVVPSVEQELRTQPFSIMHIASHGQFKNDVKDTFILTFNDKLTMDRLDQLTAPARFREAPLELLTLSACETAAGDDRAALGLAGVAIKAGARSALATLWNINDASAPLLVAEFYRQLKDPMMSRAMALQRAQLKLLQAGPYRHPYHWSAFLLINNWL